MLLIFKVVVATAGTPGPILGDNVKTTVTPLYPASFSVPDPSTVTQGRKSAFNGLAAGGRIDLPVARCAIFGRRGNTQQAFWGARGSANTDMESLAPGEGFSMGFGDRNDLNLADLDVDVANGGEALIVVAEIR